jgi:phosphonate transport system substrate-binding protein
MGRPVDVPSAFRLVRSVCKAHAGLMSSFFAGLRHLLVVASWFGCTLLPSAGCSHETSGVLEAGPAPAPRPLTEGDYHLESGELPRPGEPIRFALSPTSGSEAVRRQYTPVADFLSSVLGVPVEVIVASSYDDLVDQVAAEKVDLALLPPLSYVVASERTAHLDILATAINRVRTTYSAFILVRRDDRAQSLSDLGGRRIALVSERSTSGYLLPMSAFARHGIDPENFFSEVVMAGTHTAAIEMLARGDVDAAATATGMQDVARLFAETDSDVTKHSLRVLTKTGEAPYDALCSVGPVPAAFNRKVRGALALMNSRNVAAQPALRATETINGWLTLEDSAYDGIREVRRALKVGARTRDQP